MKPLYVLLVGVAVGWAASGVDLSREAMGQDRETQEMSEANGGGPNQLKNPSNALRDAVAAEQRRRDAGQVEVYKALTRREIEELGGIGKKEGILGPHYRYLTAGLNALANDGWFLVVIEPSLGYAKRGVHAADTVEPAVYIFERR